MTPERVYELMHRHFLFLQTSEEQRLAVRWLAAHGWSDHAIASASGRSIDFIRAILGEPAAEPKQ
jgi:hypothetical protein